jgi:hypothetical protein
MRLQDLAFGSAHIAAMESESLASGRMAAVELRLRPKGPYHKPKYMVPELFHASSKFPQLLVWHAHAAWLGMTP